MNKLNALVFLAALLAYSLAGYSQGTPDWNFEYHIEAHKFYTLKGKIDGKHAIFMQLCDTGTLCGHPGGNQWKSKGLRGWYQYERIGTKIPLVGSFNQNDRFSGIKLFVPHSVFDTISENTCSLENYREIFINESEADFTKLNWKTAASKAYKPVSLEALHDYSYKTTATIDLEIGGIIYKSVNLTKLSGLEYINDIREVARKQAGDHFYLIFRFRQLSNPASRGGGQCGAGVEEYLGFLHVNDNLELEEFKYIQTNSCWKYIPEDNVEYDVNRPEKGIREIKKD